ncbi:uncharacterized protein LOC119331690 isoform X1 [Triticum dicoccoides]|uniref:uncharacterized protein LOC119331690 isoform X1 n=1 Tax=Triticum dicoccoides TaxID=85692 RepID=UPI0018913ED5|nr:uncharacterized protein LOC119331690 isoform X1 [Triticum dicoccoides]
MGEAGEEIMVDALPPEVVDLEQEGKVDVRMEAHAVVQDVVVSEAPEVPEPEVKSEEVVVRDTTKVHLAHQPETKADEVLVRDTDTAVVVQEMEAKGEVSRSREAAGAQTTKAGYFCCWWYGGRKWRSLLVQRDRWSMMIALRIVIRLLRGEGNFMLTVLTSRWSQGHWQGKQLLLSNLPSLPKTTMLPLIPEGSN